MLPVSISFALNALMLAAGPPSSVPPPVPIPPDPVEQPLTLPPDPVLPPIAPRPILPPPVPVAPIPAASLEKVPVSLELFAQTFVPAPGTYEICFIHPGSKKPVDVVFTLPDIPLRKFEVHRRSIEFHYPDGEVEINFKLFGKVKVRYED